MDRYEIAVDIFDMEKGGIICFTKKFKTLSDYNNYFKKLFSAQLHNPKRFSFGWIGREV